MGESDHEGVNGGLRIAVSGYYGFGNIGDELILEAMIGSLKGWKFVDDIIVFSGNPWKTSKEFGVRALNRWNPSELLRGIRLSDVLISGGGGLIQDETSPFSPLYYLGILRLAESLQKPFIIYAQGVGPIKNLCLIPLVRRLFSKAAFVSFRDRNSAKLLSLRNARVFADPVFGMMKPSPSGRSNVVILVPRSLSGFRICKEVAQWAIGEGFRVVWFPFHFQEEKFLLSLIAKIGGEVFLPVRESFNEVIEPFRKAFAVFSERYHGVILSALCGVPCVGINNIYKVSWIIRELGQISVRKDGVGAATKLVESWEKLRGNIISGATELHRLALEQNEALREVLLSLGG